MQKSTRMGALRTIIATVLISIFAAAPTSAAAPRVTEAKPDNGDTAVDPKLKEIRIKFDQDMSQSGFSICGGGPTFPKTSGPGRWLTKRVFVVPVNLEPNQEYELSINCPSARNFRNAGGEEAAVYPIKFKTGTGRGGKLKKKLPARTNRDAIRKLQKAIDEQYSYRDLRDVNWHALFKQHEGKLEKSPTPQAFAREAGRMLAAAEDPHIWLKVEDVVFPSFHRSVEPNWNLAGVRRVVPGLSQRADWLYTGRFEDGIGYILITTWERNSPPEGQQLLDALQSLADAMAMIVDVRPNAGGDENLARFFASHFVRKQAVYSRHSVRDEKEKSGFSKEFDRFIQPASDEPKFAGKTAVLMGPANMSSCESFLLMMSQEKNCALIGEHSYGSSGNPKPHNLGNGVFAYLPSWKDYRPDGKLLEDRGVEPQIKVAAPPAAFASGDPVIEAALAWLRQAKQGG